MEARFLRVDGPVKLADTAFRPARESVVGQRKLLEGNPELPCESQGVLDTSVGTRCFFANRI
jgi:hypothetical protein